MKILNAKLQLIDIDKFNNPFTKLQKVYTKLLTQYVSEDNYYIHPEYIVYELLGLEGLLLLKNKDVEDYYDVINTFIEKAEEITAMSPLAEAISRDMQEKLFNEVAKPLSKILGLTDKEVAVAIGRKVGYPWYIADSFQDKKYYSNINSKSAQEFIKKYKEIFKQKVIEEYKSFNFINIKELEEPYNYIYDILVKNYGLDEIIEIPEEYLDEYSNYYSMGNYEFLVIEGKNNLIRYVKSHVYDLIDDVGYDNLNASYDDTEIEITGDNVSVMRMTYYNFGNISNILGGYDGVEYTYNDWHIYRHN